MSIKHGTNYAYDKHGCRCDACREFKRAKDRARRERNKALASQGRVPDRVHGTATGYTTYYCRCRSCILAYGQWYSEWCANNPDKARAKSQRWRAANAEKLVEARSAWAELQEEAGVDDRPLPHVPTHGASGYNYGCRCDECVAARVEYVEQWRIAAIQHAPHGTDNGYTNYGCRCDDCREAHLRRTTSQRAFLQAKTIPGAVKHGDLWTGAELETIVSRTDLTLNQLAISLRRTRLAVASARYRATHDPKWIRVVGATGETVQD